MRVKLFHNDATRHSIKFVTIIMLLVFFAASIQAQIAGDYRSAATGNWTTLASWQRYNGTSWLTPTAIQGYPGQFTGTGSVLIQSGHTITIGTGGLVTQPMGTITIQNTAQLYLTGSNSIVTVSLNTMVLNINSGGSVYFFNKVKLMLPANAIVSVTTNGLQYDVCNNNKEIWIGTSKYAVCEGAPGDIFTFAQLMAGGGTLNSLPSSNSPLCVSGSISLTGSYSGAIGSAPTYSWSVQAPGGGTTVYTTQDVTIPTPVVGTYIATLTVSTVLSGTTYTNAETIQVVVNALPTLSGASQASTVCGGSSAVINLTGLLPSTTFTISYSINVIPQSNITGLLSNVSGQSSFTTVPLTIANNGQTLQITGITVTNPVSNCSQSFSTDVVLSVYQDGSWIGVTSSDWNTASNWCGGIPTSTTDVIIIATAPFQPVIGAVGGVCRNLTINSGASVTISGSNSLAVYGNWVNNGAFVPNASTVTFSGTTAISGSSTNSFNNLSIAGSSSLTAPAANMNIAGNYTNSGTFVHNNGTITLNGTGAQQINTGGSSFNNLTISNIAGTCTVATNNVVVNGNYTTSSGSVLDMATYTLSVNTVSHSGSLLTQNTSSTPFTSGKTWGGLVNLNSAATAQNLVSGTYNNLTITTTGGATAATDVTVNGILNLIPANPSSTKGCLDMWNGSDITTLYMGATAVTTGIGDVTGRIRRTSIVENTAYTFGSQYTTITFTGGTGAQLPDELTFIVKIGSTHPIKSNAINRYYEIIRSGSNPGSSPTRFNLQLRYLDSELNGNDETKLVFWDHHVPYATASPHAHGQSSQNTTINTITLASHGIGYLVKNEYSTTGEIAYIDDITTPQSQSKIWMLSARVSPVGTNVFIWLGTDVGSPTDWTVDNNWEDNRSPTNANNIDGIPYATHYVYIPATPNKPILPDQDTRLFYLTIYNGGELNSRSGRKFQADYVKIFEGGVYNAINDTIELFGPINIDNGDVSWSNLGDFNAGTSRVMFKSTDGAVSGSTDFYDVEIPSGYKLSMMDASTMRISNTITNDGTWNTTFYGSTTVGYNGAGAQTVLLPENSEYYNLEFSGGGAKTFPASDLTIKGDFSIAGTASASPTNVLTIEGSMSIGAGTSFTGGSLTHFVGRNWSNSGTFTDTGSTINFNGSNDGNIGVSNFNNIIFSGSGLKTATGILDVGGNVSITNNFVAGAFTHTVAGNWSNSGTFTDTGSTIDFDGIGSANIGASNFNNVVFSGSGTKTATGILAIGGNVNIADNFTAGSFTHSVGGNWAKSGTFVDTGSTIDFNGSGAGNIGASNFNNIVFSGSGVKTATGILDVGGNLSITNNFTAGNYTHTVAGNWTNSGTFTDAGSTIDFDGIGSANIGASNFNHILFSGSGTKTATGILTIGGNVNIADNFTAGSFTHTVGGNWTKTGTFVDTGSTIDFNESGAGNVGASNFNNIIFSGSGTKTATGILDIGGDVSITDNWTAGNYTHTVAGSWSNSGTFTDSGSTIDFDGIGSANIGASNFNNIVFSGSGTKTATGILSIGANVNITDNFTAGNFTHTVVGNWTKSGTFIDTGSTIDFNGSGTGNIGASNFNNIVFSGTGIKTAIGNLAVSGSLSIYDNFVSGNLSHTVGGDFSNLGAFDCGTSTFTFNGSDSQTIISGGDSFYNIVFNDATPGASDFSVIDPMSITNSVSFTEGIVIISGLGVICVEDGATSTAGTVTSFVDGPFKKVGNVEFSFPLGDQGVYAPLKISAADGGGNTSDSFVAQYINENPHLYYNAVQAGIHHVSYVEYWTLDRVGTNNVFVTLSWAGRSGPVTNTDSLLVARWDGTRWTNAGNSSITGDLTAGTITSNLVSNFSPFTLGSKTFENALPVSLISFTVNCDPLSSSVIADWSCASEINSDFFVLQRSLDSKQWEEVGRLNGAGNSNELTEYKFVDDYDGSFPDVEFIYYRLKHVDFDGSYSYSTVVKNKNCLKFNEKFNVRVVPNPFENQVLVEYVLHHQSDISISISESSGKIVREFKFSGIEGQNSHYLDLSDLASATYILSIRNGNEIGRVKIVKR